MYRRREYFTASTGHTAAERIQTSRSDLQMIKGNR
jgi:hypothetical protein